MEPRQDSLRGAQRRYLRALGHHLRPVVHIGKTGLTPQVLAAIDAALTQHELIKVRFQDFKDDRRRLSHTIAETANCEHVGSVGHISLFYRRQADPDKRQIHLPD